MTGTLLYKEAKGDYTVFRGYHNPLARLPSDGQALVVVCHVQRERIRIISARFANRRERALHLPG